MYGEEGRKMRQLVWEETMKELQFANVTEVLASMSP